MIRQSRREFPHSFQYVMQMRLRDPQHACESAFGEIAVRDPVIYQPDQPPLQFFKSYGHGAGK